MLEGSVGLVVKPLKFRMFLEAVIIVEGTRVSLDEGFCAAVGQRFSMHVPAVDG